MKHINVVVIKGKEVEICTLPEKERERLASEWNERALTAIGYEKIKTA